MKRRLNKLEDARRPAPEDEHELEKWRERIRHDARHANERRMRDDQGLIFEIDDGGNVLCVRDEKPITE